MTTVEPIQETGYGLKPRPDPQPSASASRRRWLALVAVAVGTFSMVTAEQLPMGLLTPIGGAFDVSEGTAGLM